MKLGLRNLYIVPTGFGWLWLGGALFLQLVAIQTQSNGPLLLSFVMLALQLLSLHLTHGQLEGLEVRCGQPEPAFAGRSEEHTSELCRGSRRLSADRSGPIRL